MEQVVMPCLVFPLECSNAPWFPTEGTCVEGSELCATIDARANLLLLQQYLR